MYYWTVVQRGWSSQCNCYMRSLPNKVNSLIPCVGSTQWCESDTLVTKRTSVRVHRCKQQKQREGEGNKYLYKGNEDAAKWSPSEEGVVCGTKRQRNSSNQQVISSSRRWFISGLIVLSLCLCCQRCWQRVCRGQSGSRKLAKFPHQQ